MTRKLTCIIADDEPLAVRLLERFVLQTPFLELKATFTDSVAALQYVKEQPVDLLFLDIEMPELDGLEFSRMVPPASRVVFTTAYKDYALDSYEVRALDYLLKPIRYTKFLAAAEKAREWFDMKEQISEKALQADKDYVFIRVDGERVRVDYQRIAYVEGMKDYVRFHLSGERVPLTTHLTMKAVEELLPGDRFLRVHRSYIVAKDKIEKVDRTNCIYVDDVVIHVTAAFWPFVEQFLQTN